MRISNLTTILGVAAGQAFNLRRIIPPIIDESLETVHNQITQPPTIWSAIKAFFYWKRALTELTEMVQDARSNFVDDLDLALTLHAERLESFGLPSPLIQGVGELYPDAYISVLVPDIPALGPFNPYYIV